VIVDGGYGLMTRGGSSSFDNSRIRTNDPAFVAPTPAASIGNATVIEGNSGIKTIGLTVTLSIPAAGGETISWSTASGTATSGTDFTAGSGTITFAAGATTATILIQIAGDTTYEADETFTVRLTNASGVDIAGGTATVLINNDDAQAPAPTAPSILVTSQSVTEVDKGSITMTITLTLSQAWTSAISVNVATTSLGSGAGKATAGSDYTSKSGTVTFLAGQTTATFTVTIIGDRVVEGNEVFGLSLSGATGGASIATPLATMTIVDNDSALLATSAGPGAGRALLTRADVDRILPLVIATWIRKGVSRAALQNLTVTIANLTGLQLGTTSEDSRLITLDVDAAGWGWYTGTGTVPAGRIDLFSVLLHELGHLAGFEHSESGIMAAALSPGVRPAAIPKSVRASAKKAAKKASAKAKRKARAKAKAIAKTRRSA
jgi:hypothetical protein